MDTITLADGESITVDINGSTIQLTHVSDDEGHGVELNGVDCDLEGENPGLYYIAPAGTIAARYGG